MLHGTATACANMLREGAALHPGDDLALTVRAAHAAGGTQGDKTAFHTCCSDARVGGSLEVNGAALAATHRTCGRG